MRGRMPLVFWSLPPLSLRPRGFSCVAGYKVATLLGSLFRGLSQYPSTRLEFEVGGNSLKCPSPRGAPLPMARIELAPARVRKYQLRLFQFGPFGSWVA